MSLGIVGPIGLEYLADFAISQTFRLRDNANKMSIACKICGASAAKGEARAAVIGGVDGNATSVYLCRRCAKRVERASSRFSAHVRGSEPPVERPDAP
jgi:hypothetical protein